MAIDKHVRVKARLSLIINEIRDENDPVGRGGRRGDNVHRQYDLEEFEVPLSELEDRIIDAGDVFINGAELTGTEPPEAVTEQPSAITATGVIFHGRVKPNVNTSCGFLYGTTKELVSTEDADQSIIAAASDVPIPITKTMAGLTANTRYYYRAWAQIAGVRVRYGRTISFKTLAVV